VDETGEVCFAPDVKEGESMNTATIALPTVPKPNLAELLKVVGLPSKASHGERVAELADRANELIRNVVGVLDDLISSVIEKRTEEDFRKATNQIFPQYYSVMRALGDLSRIVMPQQTMERLSAEWFCELEADFRDLGPSTFGEDLTERGLFTVWTLRKISDLAYEVSESPTADSGNVDGQMAIDYATKALWTRFHMDCLVKAMRDNKPIYPEVVEPIRDGLRAAVNTYACIREWADLRNPKAEPDVSNIEWTPEDEVLLLDSMRDLDRHKS
jgi:hypothetical protein